MRHNAKHYCYVHERTTCKNKSAYVHCQPMQNMAWAPVSNHHGPLVREPVVIQTHSRSQTNTPAGYYVNVTTSVHFGLTCDSLIHRFGVIEMTRALTWQWGNLSSFTSDCFCHCVTTCQADEPNLIPTRRMPLSGCVVVQGASVLVPVCPHAFLCCDQRSACLFLCTPLYTWFWYVSGQGLRWHEECQTGI